jgi:hypothetical protein
MRTKRLICGPIESKIATNIGRQLVNTSLQLQLILRIFASPAFILLWRWVSNLYLV